MRYTLEVVDCCLRAELIGRETVDDTREFLAALARKALAENHTQLLIIVRESRTIFQVEKYGISQWFRQLAEKPGVRVALIADSSELRTAHDYIQMLAQQQKANVRAFRDEAAARDWLVPGKPVEQAEPAGSTRLRP